MLVEYGVMAHLFLVLALAGPLLRPAAAASAADCPAQLIARLLASEQQQQRGPDGGDWLAQAQAQAQASSQMPAQLQLAWPPPALKQGLTCTLELSQLSVALPGTATVCSVLRISNRLSSVLYSWQLVWQQPEGSLAAAAAPTGATLVGGGGGPDDNSDGPNPVQLINQLDSPSIAAQSGFADVLVQLGIASSSSADASEDGGDAAAAATNSTRGSRGKKGARTTTVSPAMDAVFLNGLQCTRLPLAKPPPGAGGLSEDCGTAAWALDADSRAFAMPAGLDLGNLTESSNASFFALLWGALGNTSSKSNSSSSSSSGGGGNATTTSVRLPDASVEAALQVLRRASCMSRLCCGLQVVVATDKATNSSQALAAKDSSTPPPMVGAFDGPDASTKVLLNGSKDGPGTSTAGEALPLDITPLPAAPAAENSSNSSSVAGLVAGLVVGGVSAACLGGLLLLLLRRQRRLRDALKRQASGDIPLSRNGSGADSLASVASQEWQQHQQQAARQHTILQAVGGKPLVPGWLPRASDYVLPTHNTAPAHVLQSAAADVTSGPAGTVWRASSWQGPDAPASQLLRSSSSPQSLLPPLPPPGGLASPPLLPAAGPSRQHSATQESLAAAEASAAGAAGSLDAGGGDSPGTPPPGSAPAAPSTMLSTWGSLQRLFSGGSSSGKAAAPWSSTLTSAASSSVAVGTSVSALAARTTRLQAVTPLSHQPLQLIQESAPLASTSGPAPLSQQQQPTSSPFDLAAAALGGSSRLVSRRVSPIVAVSEDCSSSVTSTDSLAPVAWHPTDRQLLEEQPGWLQIDFASEVRLEKKLGEGGFGQVFRARWRGEVIAAKLVPFMSLVAQQHSAVPLSLMSAAVGSSTGDAAAVDAAAGRQPLATALPSPHMNLGVGVQISAASLRAIKVEIRVLSQLAHPHIVAFYGAALAPPHICILEELAEGGSLHSRLYSRSNARRAQQLQQASSSSSSRPSRPRPSGGGGSSKASLLPPPLTISEVLRIAIDVAGAVAYLHALQPQVVHRDLKPSNVLLDLQGRAKVCDFGISKMKDATAASSTRLGAGTPQYMAVEQFEGCSVTDKVDVFAFGVLLWECLEQQPPWKELSPMQIIYAVGLQKERLPRPARCPAGMWRLISACWAQDPHDRPSFVEVLRTLEELQAEQQLLSEQAAGKVPRGEPEPPAPSARPAVKQPQSLPAVAQADESSSNSADAGADDVDARVAVVC